MVSRDFRISFTNKLRTRSAGTRLRYIQVVRVTMVRSLNSVEELHRRLTRSASLPTPIRLPILFLMLVAPCSMILEAARVESCCALTLIYVEALWRLWLLAWFCFVL